MVDCQGFVDCFQVAQYLCPVCRAGDAVIGDDNDGRQHANHDNNDEKLDYRESTRALLHAYDYIMPSSDLGVVLCLCYAGNMVKKRQYFIEWVCAINLGLLLSMLVFTSYGTWFNERTAVVTSMLWLFSTFPALAVSIYGIVSKKKKQQAFLVICWVTLLANIAVTAWMLLLR